MTPHQLGRPFTDAAALFGVQLSEVEGWRDRKSTATTFTPVGVMIHHTASDNTRLSTILNGNATTPGPLVPLYVEDNPANQAWLVADPAANRCNHAGSGDLAQLERVQNGQAPLENPGPDSGGGNRWWIGIELEGDGPEDFPPDGYVYRTGVALTAAICWHLGFDPLVAIIGHRNWSRRKIDPALDLPTFRQAVKLLLEETMSTAAIRLEIVRIFINRTGAPPTGAAHTGENAQERLTRLAAEVAAGKLTLAGLDSTLADFSPPDLAARIAKLANREIPAWWMAGGIPPTNTGADEEATADIDTEALWADLIDRIENG